LAERNQRPDQVIDDSSPLEEWLFTFWVILFVILAAIDFVSFEHFQCLFS
jgi:hypothetical protein